jgi:hypothetical protein
MSLAELWDALIEQRRELAGGAVVDPTVFPEQSFCPFPTTIMVEAEKIARSSSVNCRSSLSVRENQRQCFPFLLCMQYLDVGIQEHGVLP